jgi:hypothetical protein
VSPLDELVVKPTVQNLVSRCHDQETAKKAKNVVAQQRQPQLLVRKYYRIEPLGELDCRTRYNILDWKKCCGFGASCPFIRANNV